MSNAQKTPFAATMSRFAEGKARDAIQQLGKALPCRVVAREGSIVTVAFDVQSIFTLPECRIPVFGPEYTRYPIQIGSRGVVFPVDAYIGGLTGLGGGTPDLTMPANLGALVFMPVGNLDWFAVDPDVLTEYGPKGVTLRSVVGDVHLDLDHDSVTTTVPGAFERISPSRIEAVAGGNAAVIVTPGAVSIPTPGTVINSSGGNVDVHADGGTASLTGGGAAVRVTGATVTATSGAGASLSVNGVNAGLNAGPLGHVSMSGGGAAALAVSATDITMTTAAGTVTANASGFTVISGSTVLTVTLTGITGSAGASTLGISTAGLDLTNGANQVSVSSAGVAIAGTLVINGVAYTAHRHTGVTTGSGNSGGVL